LVLVSDAGTSYWQSEARDEVMQDEHVFVWKVLLESVTDDLAGARVLDIGCNRGGFLRLAYDEWGIGEGAGYDPASSAIADARRLAGPRPLRFEVGDRVPTGWGDFDVAFSHEVLYLVHDLAAHAADVFAALAPGGSYYAVMGMHAASPTMFEWHREHADELSLPRLYNLDEVVVVFAGTGFETAVSRLKVGFVPVAGPDPAVLQWLEYYNETKVLFRFTRPAR
jgi:SAM-dependent methyltransferase